MKRILVMIAALALALSLLTCTVNKEKASKEAKVQKEGKASKEEKALKEGLKTSSGRLSYALGLEIGASLKRLQTEIDLAVFARGVEDSLKGRETFLTPQEAAKVREEFMKKMQNEFAGKSQKGGKAFLAENKKKEGVVTTASGLQYMVLSEGNGPKPKATDRVSVHYRGTLVNGTEFDSSYKRGQPATFAVNGVIPGWTEALQIMKVGSKYRLFIPSNLAYGERGTGQQIGPNATLIFEVELLAIEK